MLQGLIVLFAGALSQLAAPWLLRLLRAFRPTRPQGVAHG
jgi:hypothetical protein